MHNSIDSEHRYYSLAYTHLTQSIISMINELCRIFDKGGAKKTVGVCMNGSPFTEKLKLSFVLFLILCKTGTA